MIVISGALVLVALVLLVMGVLGADLPFVYASIAVSTLSLLCLVVGILQRRGEPSSRNGDDLVPVEVPAGTSVRSGSVAVDERHEDASTTRTLSHDLLSRGRGDEEDTAAAAEDEQRWKADLDDGPEDDAQDEDARPSAGVRLVRLPQSAAAAQPQDEQDEEPDEDGVHLDEEEPGEGEEPRATVLVVPGRPRYHVEGCRYLYGKQPQDLDLGQARGSGFVACGVCKPDAALSEPAAPAGPPVEGGQQEEQPQDQQVEDQPQDDQQVGDEQREDGPQSLEETLFGEPVFGGAGAPEVTEESAAPVTTADPPAAPSDASPEQSQDEPVDGQEASLAEPEPPAEQAPEEQAPEEQAPEEQAPEEQAPEEQAAATEPPAQQAPARRAPAKKAAAKKAPGKKAPGKKAAGRKAPAKKAPATGTPARAATAATTAPPEPASTPTATPATPSVRRIRAVGAAPTRAAGAAPAVRRVSATGAARPAAAPAPPAPAAPAPAAQAAPARRAGQVLVVPDRTRFHRAECRFVQDVAGATSLSRAAAGRQGYSPCGVCKP